MRTMCSQNQVTGASVLPQIALESFSVTYVIQMALNKCSVRLQDRFVKWCVVFFDGTIILEWGVPLQGILV